MGMGMGMMCRRVEYEGLWDFGGAVWGYRMQYGMCRNKIKLVSWDW